MCRESDMLFMTILRNNWSSILREEWCAIEGSE